MIGGKVVLSAPRRCQPTPIDDAVGRGVGFITRQLQADRYGLHVVASHGQPCPADGTGHVFTAFFIARAISDLLAHAERERLLRRIRAEERAGLWGSATHLAVDSDDTAFVLRTLRMLGEPVSIRPLLSFYRRRTRAFTTFLSTLPDEVTWTPSTRANGAIHPEVNANVFGCLASVGRCDLTNAALLASLQRADGTWPSYFYPGAYYSTFIFTDFLRVCSESQECCRRAVRFVETTQDHNGSWGDPANCYDTALAILTLTQCGSDVRTVARGVASIVEHQGADGSWGCDVPIWTFRYADDPLVVCRGLDAERMITTSLCVSALRSARGEG